MVDGAGEGHLSKSVVDLFADVLGELVWCEVLDCGGVAAVEGDDAVGEVGGEGEEGEGGAVEEAFLGGVLVGLGVA